MNNLSDITCDKCGRVIAQRSGNVLYQFRMKVAFDKSGKITCPFIGCGYEQPFRVNTQTGKETRYENISIDKLALV